MIGKATLFDLARPIAKAYRSSFGGGWIVPLTDEGEDVLERFFEEPKARIPLMENGGAPFYGWVVEPQQSGDLAEYLLEAGHAWEVSR